MVDLTPHDSPTPLPNGRDQLRRMHELYMIGRVDALRLNLSFFMEDIKAIPASHIPERFAGVIMDAEFLLDKSKEVLGSSLNQDPIITDEMVEAAKGAMSWEGSTVAEEDQGALMREVLTRALANKGNKPILL